MICPNCQSKSGTYNEWWEDCWNGETEEAYLFSYWDCHVCHTRLQHYDEGFVGEDEND
jgi:hypothetical protein